MTSHETCPDTRENLGPTRNPLVGVVTLGLGTAILVASEFVPAGVLPAMAADLGVSEGRAGWAVAATSLAGALTAPTIASLIPRLDRRLALLILLAVAVVSNTLVALAPTFALVLVARVLLGVSIAGFWSLAFGVGVAVSRRPALVSTTLSVGTSLATIVAIPLAALAGDALGWRPVFGVAASLSALVFLAVLIAVPPVPAQPGAGWAMMRATLRNRRLLLGVAAIVLAIAANSTVYPYIRLVIEDVNVGAVAVLLLAFGLGGLAGNVLGGWLSRWVRWAATLGPAMLAVGFIIIATTHSTPALAFAIVVWGVGFGMAPVTTQLWTATVEPRRAESAISLQVTAFQVAITLGSIVGGLLVDARGVQAAVQLGIAAAALGALVFASTKVVPRQD